MLHIMYTVEVKCQGNEEWVVVLKKEITEFGGKFHIFMCTAV